MEEEPLRARAKNKLIRVTFPSGKSFCYTNSSATMIAALAEIGSDKFPDIELELCHLPLLSREVYPRYKEWMKPVCDGWYINLQSSSDQKYMQLRAISDQLSLGLKVELGTSFSTEKEPNRERKSRVKDKLQVKFPNGDCVAKSSALETFLETIRRLGVDNIMRKNLSWGNHSLVTTSQVVKFQVQIVDRRWVVVPNMTKDKAKLLRLVGAMLHTELDITVS